MDSKLDIPLHGTSLNIVRRCGARLSAILESKFGCVATIDGVDFESDPHGAQQRRPTVHPEKRFAATLRGGVQVSVWKADLADFQVDAVVNAANDRLEHIGGLAKALSVAGGPQIQKESDDFVKRYGALRTGDALVLGAGSLRCKKIIHAVGPQLFGNPSTSDFVRAEGLLEKVIRSILDKVKENRLDSVAIPAISSGLFHYPLPECAKTIVSTVRHYYEYALFRGHLPKEIFLVNNDEPTVAEMEKVCRQIFPNGESIGDAKTSAPPVQLGSVRLTLKKGKIEEQQTDVIVNTTSSKRNLKGGEISKALLEKAGDKMQEELYAAHAQGTIFITKGHKLQCKEVFHTFCTEKGSAAAQQILLKSVYECLWMAATRKHKSISFPAIGTGALGFHKKESAQIMSQAVADLARNFQEKMDVYFVIFPSDNNTFKAFEEQMRSLKQTASRSGFPQAPEHRDDLHGGGGGGSSSSSSSSSAPRPQISLNSFSHEAAREADRWLSGLLFRSYGSYGSVVVRNNFIQHFGQREHVQLSRLLQTGLSIEEFFESGHAGLIVSGESDEDVVVAALQVEAMLCLIQSEFVKEEECTMLQAVMTENLSFERKLVDNMSTEFLEKLSGYKKHGLYLLKMDKVENSTLETLFDLKRNQLRCSAPPRTMLQRIPAHFCEMVSRIGFHAEYAPPDEPEFGEGIYFAGKLKTALEVWKVQKEEKEEYLYFVEAEVLTGNSTPGREGLILPPAVGKDPLIRFDSVHGGPDVSVIFSGYQARPKYVLTCKAV